MNLDLEDELVRKLAEANHTPEETWFHSTDGENVLTSVRCETCKGEWPCETRQALRDREARKLKEHYEFLESLSPGARKHLWWL